jgi:hypothetical protein
MAEEKRRGALSEPKIPLYWSTDPEWLPLSGMAYDQCGITPLVWSVTDAESLVSLAFSPARLVYNQFKLYCNTDNMDLRARGIYIPDNTNTCN